MSEDEFALLADNAAEVGLRWDAAPVVQRTSVDVGHGQKLSAIAWGEAPPELVFLHGGAQNAHTWDTTVLALSRPAVAIDLPGHGHSDWREDRVYTPEANAEAVASAITRLAPSATAVIGMSLGGLTAIRLAATDPALVRSLVVVDVTPGTDREKAKAIIEFVSGPETFATFDEILERTIRYNPTRSESSLRRGVIHNTRQLPDGTWAWRYDRHLRPESDVDFGDRWRDVEAIGCPVMLVRGSLSPVVDDADEAEFRRRQPTARIETVAAAGHSVQGDQPVALAALIADFVVGP